MNKLLWACFFIVCGVLPAAAQQGPSSLPGCVYNATPPTLSDKQQTVWQCDVNGKLITSGSGGGGTPGGVDTQVQINNAGAFGGAPEYVESANVMGQRNGANPQERKLYNTYDGTNNEYLDLIWSANVATIQSVATGTGTIRSIVFAGGFDNVTDSPGSVTISPTTNSANNGGTITLAAGTHSGGSGADGGDVVATGGRGGSSTGRGGDVTVTSGPASTSGAGVPGSITLTQGTFGSTNNGTVTNTSVISITGAAATASSAGNGTGTTASPITMTGGLGGNATNTTCGPCTGGVGGGITFTTGGGGSATGASGTTRNGGNSGTMAFGTGTPGTGASANGTPGPITFSPGGTEVVRVASDLTFRHVKTFLVAALPACVAGTLGETTIVTDATVPTYLGVLVGSGAVVTPVVCNGSAWVSY